LSRQSFLGWLRSIKSVIKRPGFWFLAVLLVLITVPYYGEQLKHPAFLTDLLTNLGLDRHAFERIAYLVPIIWAAFLLGQRAAFITSLFALGCMLPRAIFFSSYSADALFETSAVFVLGNVVAFSFSSLRKERERRTELEKAQSALHFQLQVVKENEQRLAALNQTAAILSQSLELHEVLDKATENVMNVMQVEAALIYLLETEAGELSLAAYRGISAEQAKGVASIKLGGGFSGRVAMTGEPLYVEDASQDSRLFREVAKTQGVKSLLSVPMKSKGKVMGTLSVFMHSHRWFREDEVGLLTAIANQIGVATENARLYEKERLAIQRLGVSERNYRGLFENANDAIWVHDLKGNIIVANRACERQTGYSMEELTKINVKDFLTEESRSLAMQVRHKLFKNEPFEQPYEQRLLRKDGTEAILKLTTSLVIENEVPTGFQNISRDVTEEKRMRENLDFYLGEVTKAQEEERTRIARELHDDTIQALVVLARQLDNLSSSDKDIPKDKAATLEDLWRQTNNVIQGVRRLSQDLRPPALDRLGLLPALEWLVSDVARYSNIPIRTEVVGTERRLPPQVELMLFRITQEALRNVWRHSQATDAEVTVEFEVRRIKITIKDNGKGFDLPGSVGDLTRSGKLGLAGMQERARLVGGSVDIRSEAGKGTAITIEAPI